jgi:hypothetical protein
MVRFLGIPRDGTTPYTNIGLINEIGKQNTTIQLHFITSIFFDLQT